MFGTYDLVHSLPSCTKALLNRYSTLQAGHVHCPIYQELESVCVSLEHISGSLCKSRRDPGILANHKCIKLFMAFKMFVFFCQLPFFSPTLSSLHLSILHLFEAPVGGCLQTLHILTLLQNIFKRFFGSKSIRKLF